MILEIQISYVRPKSLIEKILNLIVKISIIGQNGAFISWPVFHVEIQFFHETIRMCMI